MFCPRILLTRKSPDEVSPQGSVELSTHHACQGGSPCTVTLRSPLKVDFACADRNGYLVRLPSPCGSLARSGSPNGSGSAIFASRGDVALEDYARAARTENPRLKTLLVEAALAQALLKELPERSSVPVPSPAAVHSVRQRFGVSARWRLRVGQRAPLSVGAPAPSIREPPGLLAAFSLERSRCADEAATVAPREQPRDLRVQRRAPGALGVRDRSARSRIVASVSRRCHGLMLHTRWALYSQSTRRGQRLINCSGVESTRYSRGPTQDHDRAET